MNLGDRTKRIAILPLLGFLWIVPLGCEPEPDHQLSQSRDSAGIRIIENPIPDDEAEEDQDGAAPPKLQIGTAAGEDAYLFQGPLYAAQQESSGIVVLDGGLDEIRWFDAEGRHLRTAAGHGDGPAEFRNPGGLLLLPGDSVLVHDEGFPRLTLFGPDGSFVRTWNLESPPASLVAEVNYFRPAPFGRLRDGRTLHLASLGGTEQGHNRRTAVVLAFDPTGRWLGPLIEFPGGDWWVEVIPGGRRSEQGLGDRSAMAATDGETVYVGNGDEYAIRAYDSGGLLRRIIRRAGNIRPTNQAQVDSAVAQMRELAKDLSQGQLPEFERMVAERKAVMESRLSHYETMPAFYSLVVDRRNRVWVRTKPSAFQYDVFSPEGSWLRSVALPSRPLFLGASAAVVSRTGEFGEPLLEVIPITLEREDPGGA